MSLRFAKSCGIRGPWAFIGILVAAIVCGCGDDPGQPGSTTKSPEVDIDTSKGTSSDATKATENGGEEREEEGAADMPVWVNTPALTCTWISKTSESGTVNLRCEAEVEKDSQVTWRIYKNGEVVEELAATGHEIDFSIPGEDLEATEIVASYRVEGKLENQTTSLKEERGYRNWRR